LDGQSQPDVQLRDLGEHRFKDILQPVRVFQVVEPNLQNEFPLLRALEIFPNNLPTQLTSFIGRRDEIAAIKRYLTKTHLLTLTGSGGTGKTRLSLQVAAELLNTFKDGVWFVELAPITDPDLVAHTVAGTLGVREERGRSLMSTLLDWFSDKDVLLVLDNCEHLLDACAKFADAVLREGHEVRILASSREALGIAGETAYRVPSLPTPDRKEALNIEQLQDCESAQLFIERATQILPTFKVTDANSSSVSQICQRLDGIPLAIELAAARVKVLSVEQISARLDDRFRLLTGGSRTALPRQQTLRALIDWSYQLLSEQERLLFRRLAVFVGGWTLESAEAVCGFDGIEAVDILDLMTHLVDKSLVLVETSGKESRYHRLETIRQYAREKFFETEEAAHMRDRHLDYFRTLAEKAEVEILSSNQVAWLGRLQDEFDNIRAALEWSQEKRVEDGLQLGSAIWRFGLRYGFASELVEKLNQLLSHPQGIQRTLVRAKTLSALSTLAGIGLGDYSRQRAWAEESLAISEELEDPLSIANGLAAVGITAYLHGDPNGLSLMLQGLALYRSLNAKVNMSDILILIGIASEDSVKQQAFLEEALALARERGDSITMAGALDNLGRMAMYQGHFTLARTRLEESLEIQLPLGSPGYITTLLQLSILGMHEGKLAEARAYGEELNAMSKQFALTMAVSKLWSLPNWGYIALREGNLEQAREMFNLAIQSFQKADRFIGIVYSIEGVASLYVKQGRLEHAAQLFAWTDAMREKAGDQRPPVEQASMEKDLAVIHSQMDDSEFENAYNTGHSLTEEQAIALALHGAA
jgi:predicted ATPase/Tfp pilus assembly protein PilF